MVLALIVTHAGAEAPLVGQLETEVQLERPGLEPLVFGLLIPLGPQAQSARHREPEGAAVLLGVLDRRLAGRGVAGVAVLHIEGDATVAAVGGFAEPDAQVGAVGSRLRVGERGGGGAVEPESAILGSQRA